jgi:hypothetical protein
VTSAPSALTSCTVNVPTPPNAPITSTCCPGQTRPWSRTPCRPVHAQTEMAAACSRVSRFGLRTSLSTAAQAYCANEPRATPNTSSATRSPLTVAPIDSTRPATSVPSTRLLGCAGRNRDHGRCMYRWVAPVGPHRDLVAVGLPRSGHVSVGCRPRAVNSRWCHFACRSVRAPANPRRPGRRWPARAVSRRPGRSCARTISSVYCGRRSDPSPARDRQRRLRGSRWRHPGPGSS